MCKPKIWQVYFHRDTNCQQMCIWCTDSNTVWGILDVYSTQGSVFASKIKKIVISVFEYIII